MDRGLSGVPSMSLGCWGVFDGDVVLEGYIVLGIVYNIPAKSLGCWGAFDGVVVLVGWS